MNPGQPPANSRLPGGTADGLQQRLADKHSLQRQREKTFLPGSRFQNAGEAAACFTRIVDDLMTAILRKNINIESQREKFCLVALGGYGRGELCPYSDIDILILYHGNGLKEKIKKAVTACWDLGMQLGIVVRTLRECQNLLGEDLASDTACLESRFIFGNKKLFHDFKQKIIKPWFRREQARYIKVMHNLIRRGVFSEKSSMYRIEPNLKEGICALRDCHRLFWSLAVKNNLPPADKGNLLHSFRKTDRDKFLAAYYFLLGLRHELHMLYGRRMDILEAAGQQQVIESLGPDFPDAARLMQRYFQAVTEIRNFLLLFLEQTLTTESRWTRIRRRLSAINLPVNLSVVDGILFLKPAAETSN